jgi:hypothetical protein
MPGKTKREKVCKRKYSTHTNISEKSELANLPQFSKKNFEEGFEQRNMLFKENDNLLNKKEENFEEFYEIDEEEEKLLMNILKYLNKKKEKKIFPKIKKAKFNIFKRGFESIGSSHLSSCADDKSNTIFKDKSDLKNTFIYKVLGIDASKNNSNGFSQISDGSLIYENLLSKKKINLYKSSFIKDSFLQVKSNKKEKFSIYAPLR